MVIRSRWSNLPKELLEKISNHIDTHLDLLRFRAVCTSWRRSSTPHPTKPPLLPLKLPFPLAPQDSHPSHADAHYLLTQSVVYVVQPLEIEPSSSAASSTTPACRGWLVRVQQAQEGTNRFRILSPLSDRDIKNVNLGNDFPKVLNLLDFRFSEVSKVYHLKFANGSSKSRYCNDVKFRPRKVVFLSGSDANEYTVIAIDNKEQLYYVKNGEEKWTRFNQNHNYVDIIGYNGTFYAVDRWGDTRVFDSKYNDRTIADGWEYGGSKKVLVECCGKLFLADITLDVDRVHYDYDEFEGVAYKMGGGTEFRTAIQIKFYCLEMEKHKWEQVKSLGDQMLFLGDDCSFSVSTQDFAGYKGNFVYYADQGIELRFEKDMKANSFVYLDCGHDDFSDDGDHHDHCDDEFGGYGNYWECDCGDSSDDDISVSRNRAYANVKGASDDVLKGLEGHNIGVYDVDNEKFGSLLMFRERATIFWPPPSWLKRN